MKLVKVLFLFITGIVLGMVVLFTALFTKFESTFQNRVYPGVFFERTSLSGKTTEEVESFFSEKSKPFQKTNLHLSFEDKVATLSADELNMSYDGKLAGVQALSFGRQQNPSSFVLKIRSFLFFLIGNKNTPLATINTLFSYNKDLIAEKVSILKDHIDIPSVEPQFEFNKDIQRVSTFKLGKPGRVLNAEKTLFEIEKELSGNPGKNIALTLPVETIEPKTGDENIDSLGITELIGRGESYYKGSIPGRIHNVILASSRASGILVGPGETFSFNDTVGDISAATGYKTAYIIKNGRTELGDGGGVCQVSTTLFRAALNAGLEIVERKPHSYRVAYYEQGGFKPGLDATVYAPSVDLKIKNNTDNHILIEAIPDPTNYHLTYEIYGKKDGRNIELSDIRILSQSPAPPPMYQEDPTLKNGEIKQVDFAASGAKTTFDYKVVKNGEVLGASTFVNNFKPWQAVYLYGPGTSVPTPLPPKL